MSDTVPPDVRFWRYVNKTDTCWLWTGSASRGYGAFTVSVGRTGVSAYRYAYELLVGPIPNGLELDHLCRVRQCVNPAHLEPVTHRENLMRGATIIAKHAAQTHCLHGHPFDEANTYTKRGARECRACRATTSARFRGAK